LKAYAILLCAGSGRRMREEKNKVLLSISGKPAIYRSLETIKQSGCFDKTYLVVRPQDKEQILACCYDLMDDSVSFVNGGKERQDSVYNALMQIPEDAQIIAVHDAARCFASEELFKKCIKSAYIHGSGAAARRCVDTVKRVDGQQILDTLNRDELVLIETPQVFRAADLRAAYLKAMAEGFLGTDDCSVMEYAGFQPSVVIHSENNFKLTFKSDVKRGEDMFKSGNMRIGSGMDAHKLVEGRRLVLGGTDIPYEKGLLGHSDADVLTHAIMDAILGAAGEGDIGRHFPDSDEKYRDANSIELLKEVYSIIAKQGYYIGNIDATIVAQRPKLSSYIEKMRKNIAKAVCASVDRVNVKATTTENMGFEGRGEGISANAVCIIEKQV